MKGARLSSDVGGKPETSHGVVTYHKVTLKRSTEGTTAKEPVVRENHRRNHSQGASGENPRQNHSQRACGEKEEVKQQGYEDSEKNTKIWSDDEKNREEQSEQQARQEQSQRQARQEQSQRQAREEHGQQQVRQTKGLRARQGEVRGETQCRGKLQRASPEAGAMRAEA